MPCAVLCCAVLCCAVLAAPRRAVLCTVQCAIRLSPPPPPPHVPWPPPPPSLFSRYQESIATQVGVLKSLVAEVQASPIASTEKGANMLKDLTGQVSEATSRIDWFKKWGRHYLPSLMFAHLNQQCNNFKDPGVQSYGGDLFEAIRDEADDVFTDLPPPVPTRIVPQTQQQMQAAQCGAPAPAAAPRAAVPMARYHQSDAPCFSAGCVVQTLDSGAVLAGDLRKGDRVLTPAGDYAAVICVVVSRCATGKVRSAFRLCCQCRCRC